MVFPRTASDESLLRALRLRAASDPVFRESLARAVTADAKYEDYVQRKKDEGGTPLPREEWEAYVFGREPGEGGRKQRSLQKMKRQILRRRQRMWGRSMWSPGDDPESSRQFKPKRLFKSEETRDLPRWAAQPTSDPEELFEQVDKAQGEMLDWLDRGAGIDQALGAKTVRRDEDPQAEIDYESEGPVVVIGPPKTREAAEDKVRQRYGGDWSEGGVDLVRASIAVDRYEDLQEVVDKLKESGIELVSQPRNRFRDATAAGYRDVVLNARLPSGHVMELQLHLKPILAAKERNHALYSQIKGLDDKVRDKEELPEDVMQQFQDLTSRQRQVYEQAWEESTSRSEPSSIFDPPSDIPGPKRPRVKLPTHAPKKVRKKKGEEEPLYFDVDGLPVKWVPPKMPMVHGVNDPYRIDSLAWFAEKAVPITEEEFDKLVEARSMLRTLGTKQAATSVVDALRRRAATNPEFRRALRRALTSRQEEQ